MTDDSTDEIRLRYPADAFPDTEPLVRPLAHGYLRADLVADINRAMEEMRRLAHANGYQLEDALIFADHDSAATEFAALRYEIGRTEARAVFLPSRDHLADSHIEQLRHIGAGVWSMKTRTCWPAIALPVNGMPSLPHETANEAQRLADRLIDAFRRERRSTGNHGR